MVISSFSASGTVVLRGVLEGKLMVNKLVFFAPWLPDFDKYKDQVVKLYERNIKVYLICGDKDQACFDMSNDFVAELSKLEVD